MKYKLKKWYPSLPENWEEGDIVEKNLSYPSRYEVDGKRGFVLGNEVENNPEFWEEVKKKNYKILKVKASPSHPYYSTSTFNSHIFNYSNTNKNLEVWDIYSVKRLSDGEVFTVGDKISGCVYSNKTIQKFNIGNRNNLYIETELGFSMLPEIKHVKPLFTTEDGVDIYEGDLYHEVRGNKTYYSTFEAGNESPEVEHTDIKFSTKEKAEEYIDQNKPRYSKAEVREAISQPLWDSISLGMAKRIQEELDL